VDLLKKPFLKKKRQNKGKVKEKKIGSGRRLQADEMIHKLKYLKEHQSRDSNNQVHY
jgi:hypothetical protein